MFTSPLSPPGLGSVDPVQRWGAAQGDLTWTDTSRLGLCVLCEGLQRHKGKLEALSLPTAGLGGAVPRQAGL